MLDFGITRLSNNERLDEFAKDLFSYPLPPDTVEIDRSYAISPPPGNGDKCWFTAELVLASQLSKEEIQAYYKDVTFPELQGKAAFVHKSISPALYFQERVPGKDWTSFIIRMQDNDNEFMVDPRCW